MPRRIFLDCEFTNLPWTGHSDLLWVGLADEDGNSWSAINTDVAIDERASEFTRTVVAPLMVDAEPRLARAALAEGIRAFCGSTVDEFWAWCPTAEQLAGPPFSLGADAPTVHTEVWDWDLQLLQRCVDPWPPCWTSTLNDLQALVQRAGVTPPPNPGAHHPRIDAEHGRAVYNLAARALPDIER